MILMGDGFVVENVRFGNPLPLWSARWWDQWSQAVPEEVSILADIHDVENNSLIQLNVIHGKVEPESVTRIASIGSQEEIVFEFSHQISSAQVSRLKCSIEAQVTSFRLSTVSWWADDNATHVSQSSFSVTIFTVCEKKKIY